MPHPITIPRLGWSMEEGVFGTWLKASGDVVRVGEMIFVLEGEKAATEIESLDSGRLCIPADAPEPGATVKVGDVIGYLLAEGEIAPDSVRSHPSVTQSQSSDPVGVVVPSISSALTTISAPCPSSPRVAGPAARRLARELGIDLGAVFTPDPTGRVVCEDVQRAAWQRSQRATGGRHKGKAVATPRARRRAKELGVDWARLDGTGRNGRVRERDVMASSVEQVAKSAGATDEIPPTEPGRYLAAGRLRRVIAQRMSAGAHLAVPVTLTTKVGAEPLVAYREQLQGTAPHGLVPTYNDILIYWVARTILELRDLNACWYRQGVHLYDGIHIATAVDTPEGLLAPVVRDADRRTLLEIAEVTRTLIGAARAGQLRQDQLSGGTFTISNLGMYGVDAFTPVLNLPQAAILGVGRIVEEPVVRSGQVVAGKTLTLSLTFDHRVVDGAPAARWLQRLCQRMESPTSQPTTG